MGWQLRRYQSLHCQVTIHLPPDLRKKKMMNSFVSWFWLPVADRLSKTLALSGWTSSSESILRTLSHQRRNEVWLQSCTGLAVATWRPSLYWSVSEKHQWTDRIRLCERESAQLDSKGKGSVSLPDFALCLEISRVHALSKCHYEDFLSKIVRLSLLISRNLTLHCLIPFYNINYYNLIYYSTISIIMDTDYFLDTVQWIFVSVEFASMLLFSFVMYGYCKNNKVIKKVQSSR